MFRTYHLLSFLFILPSFLLSSFILSNSPPLFFYLSSSFFFLLTLSLFFVEISIKHRKTTVFTRVPGRENLLVVG